MQSNQRTEPTDEDNTVITRRNAIRSGAAALAVGGALTYGYGRATQDALAVTAAAYAVNGATATTDDGTITDITIGDNAPTDNAGIDLNWEGFEGASETVNFTLEARLTADVDGTESTYEQLTSGSYTLSGQSGSVSLDYDEVFPAATVSLFDHSAISAADFAATTDGGSVTRTLECRITATAPSASDTDSATGDLTVDNLVAASDVGGTVDTTIVE